MIVFPPLIVHMQSRAIKSKSSKFEMNMQEWISSLGSSASAVLSVSCIFLISQMIGDKALAIFRFPPPKHAFFRNILSICLGLDIVSLLSYAIVTSGIFACLGGSLARNAIVAISIARLLTILAEHSWKNQSYRQSFDFAKKNSFFILSILCLGGISLGNSLCPPIAWDELVYQISVPLRWLSDKSAPVYGDNPYSAFPGASSFLFMFSIYLGGIISPRLLVWSMWMLNFSALYLLLRLKARPIYAGILSLAFNLSSAVMICGSAAYAENFILLNFLCALIALRLMKKSGSSRGMLLPGFMCGIAAAVKLTGLISGVSLLGYQIFRSAIERRASRGILFFALSFICVGGAFYIRSAVFCGNPFHPYFSELTTDDRPAVESSRYHHKIGSVKYGNQSLSDFIFAPILISVPGGQYDGDCGYQFIIVCGLAGFSVFRMLKTRNIRDWLCLLAVLFFFQYAFWFFSSQQARFFLIPAVLLYIIAGHSLHLQASPFIRILVSAALILSFASLPQKIFSHMWKSWDFVLGKHNWADYVHSASKGDYFLPSMQAVLKTAPNSKFLMIYENRTLYMPRRFETGTPFFQAKQFTPPENFSSPAEILKVLKQGSFTHLYVGLEVEDPDRLSEYLDRSLSFAGSIGKLRESGHLHPLFENKGCIIFEVLPSPRKIPNMHNEKLKMRRGEPKQRQ